MARTLYDNEMLRRYLLGTASADEAARLDELSLIDDDCALALAQAENDLVDAYAHASLAEPDRAQFEQHYLASPVRREKVQFARTLQQQVAASRTAAVARAPAPTSWFAWLNLTPHWQAGLATAASLLLAAGVWLGWENRRLRQQSEAERIALTQRETELKVAAAQSQEELARVREKLTAVQVPTPVPLPVVPAAQLFTFTLVAPLRAATALPKVAIPLTANAVSVRLELETNTYRRYRAALRDPLTNRLVWQSGNLTTKGQAVIVRLPSKLFAAQRYAFELSGVAANGAEERLSSYPFSVVEPSAR